MGIPAVGDYLRHNAARYGGKTALIDGERAWTYSAIDNETDRVAAALAARGVRPGDRVGILAGASANWVLLFFGIVKSGAIAACLNYRDTPDRLAGMIASVGTKLLFLNEATAAAMRGEAGLPETADLEEFVAAALANNREAPAMPSPDPSGGAVILFTGGTTGVSKGVLLSHANLFWNSVNEILDTRMNEWDTSLIATALHHSAALNTWLLPHLYLGGAATILREFTPGGWIELMQRDGATNSFAPPTMARQIAKYPGADKADWSRFKRFYSGAGILPRHEREELEALCPGLGIYYEYGLTEAGPIVTCLQPEDYERAPESIGRAVRHCEIRILDEERRPAPAGEIGQVAVRGPAVMSQYFGRPVETAAAFHEGWLMTGDLAAADEAGFLSFHDRSKDMIKSGGLNIYSQEVEQVLSHHPSIREVAVVGLSDGHWGEKVVAVITLHDGREESEGDLIAYARKRLAGYQTPKEIMFMSYDAVPKNYLGKILKRELREMLRASPTGGR